MAEAELVAQAELVGEAELVVEAALVAQAELVEEAVLVAQAELVVEAELVEEAPLAAALPSCVGPYRLRPVLTSPSVSRRWPSVLSRSLTRRPATARRQGRVASSGARAADCVERAHQTSGAGPAQARRVMLHARHTTPSSRSQGR